MEQVAMAAVRGPLAGTLESIKEVKYRVKGTEKLWNHPAEAEAILQVRAATPSDDDRLARCLTTGSPHRYTRRVAA